MTRWKAGLLAAGLSLAILGPVIGAAIVPVGTVAPIGDLEKEAAFQLKTLEGLLKDSASFEEMTHRKKLIPRAAGVLAVVGQTLAEHPQKSKTKILGTFLRDAARKVVTAKSYEDATAGLKEMKEAVEGRGKGEAGPDLPWNKLMSLHRLMEEVEERQGELRKTFVAIGKGQELKPSEAYHATTLALLGIVTIVDNHEVKKKEEIPEWESMAKEFQGQLTSLSKAMHDKDSKAFTTLFPKIGESCASCHDKFRH